MSISINRATIYDHGAIVELLIAWFDECQDESIPRPCAYSGQWLADLIAKHIVLVAKHDGKLIGVIGLKFTHFPWNNEVSILTDNFFMTDPEYRYLGVADKLIKASKSFAKEFKHILVIGHFSGLHPELKDRYLSSKHGFKYLGGNFIYKGE
jgi:GNAT superfamily N-acetyltransferase